MKGYARGRVPALAAALEIGARPAMRGQTIVVILQSLAERYLSTDLLDGF